MKRESAKKPGRIGLKINHERTFKLMTSETFKEDVKEILFAIHGNLSLSETKRLMRTKIQMAVIFIAVAISNDDKGQLKLSFKEMIEFVTDNYNYLLRILERIINYEKFMKKINVREKCNETIQ